jgi:positive regulator of sigma E activity
MNTISKKGFVVENNNGYVKVMIQRDSGCGSCSTCGGCDVKPSFVTTYSTLNVKPGDEVFLDSDYKQISNLTKFIYAFPVIMMIIGAILPNILFKESAYDLNLLTILFVVIFLLISLFTIRKFDNRYKGRDLIKLRKLN